MTRNEFLENVTWWGDLKEFCSDEGCDICDDIYDEEDRDEYINECLVDWARNDTWQELFDRLRDIPDGYDYYRDDEYNGWVGADDSDFDQYKDDVLDWADDHEVWDDDEDEEDDEWDGGVDVFAEELARDAAAREEDESVADEDFSVGDLIGMCSVAFVAIQKDSVRRIQEDDKRFSDFVDVNMPKTLK